MAEKNKYLIENIYQGGYSTFKPYPTAGNFPVGTLGETTNPRTANILKEVSDKLASGTKHIEVEAVTPEVFDSIPKQYFKEVDRLAKLTGSQVSLHAPVMDVAGMSQSGFSESQRELAQRKVAQTLLRGQELDPKGNVTINFHSAEGIPGSEFLPPSKREKEESQYKRMIAVDRNTGRLLPLEKDIQYTPDMRELKPEIVEKYKRGEITGLDLAKRENYVNVPLEKGRVLTPEDRLESLNKTQWENELDQLIFNKERADELLRKNEVLIRHVWPNIMNKEISNETLEKYPEQKEALSKIKIINSYLEDLHDQVSTKFSKAYEFGNKEQREKLTEISKDFKQNLDKDPSIFGRSKAMEQLLLDLKENRQIIPEMYMPIEKFALENSSKTFGNAAFEAYKKFKDKTPTLVIENPPAGFALSTGEDIKNIVEESRKKFIENATKSKDKGGLGMDKDDAQKAANKVIGATIDVGHINMLKKYGYSDKEIANEVGKFAPYLKHIHLSDNFGNEHTELPMGMGNVPLKEMLEKLKGKGVDVEGMTKIIEAGGWWTNFQSSPFYASLNQMGSPIYSTRVSPYWNQAVGLHQDYYGGFGMMLPQTNYETFGAGFSTLPQELGGQRPGAQGSRLSGRGME